MTIQAISIEVPPVGELETSEELQVSPTDAQMDEEMSARQKFLDDISPYFASLPARHVNRTSNVSRVELSGSKTWSTLNHYQVLLTVDLEGDYVQELLEKLPKGSKVLDLGSFESLQTWGK